MKLPSKTTKKFNLKFLPQGYWKNIIKRSTVELIKILLNIEKSPYVYIYYDIPWRKLNKKGSFPFPPKLSIDLVL